MPEFLRLWVTQIIAAIYSTVIVFVVSCFLLLIQLFITGFGDGYGGGMDSSSLFYKWLFSIPIAIMFGATCSMGFGIFKKILFRVTGQVKEMPISFFWSGTLLWLVSLALIYLNMSQGK